MPKRPELTSAVERDIASMRPGERAAVAGVVVSADGDGLRALLSDATGECRVVVGVEMLKDLKEGSVVRIVGVPFDADGKKALEAEFVQDMAGCTAAQLSRVRDAERTARKDRE